MLIKIHLQLQNGKYEQVADFVMNISFRVAPKLMLVTKSTTHRVFVSTLSTY